MAIQAHRNGVESITVEILSIKDNKGNETNDWFGRKPGSIINMIRGEAERLIRAKRAIDIADKKPPAKRGRPPKAKAAVAPSNK